MFMYLGTIHKRHLPKGGGRGVPPKGDVRRWGEGPLLKQRRRLFLPLKSDKKCLLKWAKMCLRTDYLEKRIETQNS